VVSPRQHCEPENVQCTWYCGTVPRKVGRGTTTVVAIFPSAVVVICARCPIRVAVSVCGSALAECSTCLALRRERYIVRGSKLSVCTSEGGWRCGKKMGGRRWKHGSLGWMERGHTVPRSALSHLPHSTSAWTFLRALCGRVRKRTLTRMCGQSRQKPNSYGKNEEG
jgi:hypothetical protein